jgi:hypothetical protein
MIFCRFGNYFIEGVLLVSAAVSYEVGGDIDVTAHTSGQFRTVLPYNMRIRTEVKVYAKSPPPYELAGLGLPLFCREDLGGLIAYGRCDFKKMEQAPSAENAGAWYKNWVWERWYLLTLESNTIPTIDRRVCSSDEMGLGGGGIISL